MFQDSSLGQTSNWSLRITWCTMYMRITWSDLYMRITCTWSDKDILGQGSLRHVFLSKNGFIPIMGAPALAILTAHSPGVKPSPSPCGPEASCYYIIILRSNIVKLIWSYEHMIIYMIIFIWAYMIIWSDIINLIYMIWPMHIVAATGLLYRKARSIAHSISRMLWKYWEYLFAFKS